VETSKHRQPDRIRIAGLAGTIERHAYRVTRSEGTVDEAVAELHTISTDPHLLAHAAGDPARSTYSVRLRILEAAGAAMAEVDQIWSARHGRATRVNLG
jgi:hypothetical protein